MKIVHVTQFFHPTRGYQENHLSILQAKAGHDVVVVCTDDLTLWGTKADEIKRLDRDFEEKNNIKIIRLKKVYKFSTRIFVKGLNKVLNKKKPDLLIIHAVSLPMSLQAMKWGANNNVRMIVDDHMVEAGSFNKFSKYFYVFFKIFFQFYLKMFNIKINKWVAVSYETKEFMIKNYGITDNIYVVPLGYDDTTVFKDVDCGKRWLKENNLPDNKPYILYIGKFDNMKNPIDLIEPFNIFVKKYPEFKLLMVGDSSLEYKEELLKKINEFKLEDKIFIRKAVPNEYIRCVFSIAQMAIWPHGSSMSMLESMACECPVIATNINVNKERLLKNRGFLFEENDIQDLVNKMDQAIINRVELVTNAKLWVVNFSWRKLLCDFIK